MAASLMMPGCGGCTKTSKEIEEARAKKEKELLNEKDLLKQKEKPKPDFEPVKLHVMPQKTDETEAHRLLVKPGHWTAAVEEMKANNFDFVGQLYADTRPTANDPPTVIDRTPYRLAITRPAPLAKGQPKFFEMLFYVPGSSQRGWLATELRGRGGGMVTTPGPEPLTLLKAHQYNMVVLAAEPDRYRHLDSDKRFDSILAPHMVAGSDLTETILRYYNVVEPALSKPVALPSNVLAWTNIAYLIWDDVDPSLLSPEQQQAIIDWLHWGGQIIISGPKTLDQLRDKSFLAPYLPATAGEPITIDSETLAPINKIWTLDYMQEDQNRNLRKLPGRPLAAVRPWSGVTLALHKDAQTLEGTANLAAERQIGRGRIVVTAFRLTQRELWNWPGFDGFLNACLLRRPSRVFSDDGGGLNVDWNLSSHHVAADPLLVTKVRFLSRDWDGNDGFAAAKWAQSPVPPVDENSNYQFNPATGYIARPRDLAHDPVPMLGPGIAGWNDFSSVSNAARESLQQAAGIVIPDTGFVVRVLAMYLVVLVPVNWLAFKAIGRVEWAWIAAPFIAVGGMAAVVKLAQLDIGFARSQTEVALLEMHNGYPRGHLTRYSALYTSLSTTYDASSEDPNALVLPFPADPQFTPLSGQSIDTVTYHCDRNVQLSDFAVSSNSTAFLHSEQIVDLGGAISYAAGADDSGGEVTNATKQDLKQVAVIRGIDGKEHEIAWIGDLAAGASAKITFYPTGSSQSQDARRDGNYSVEQAGESVKLSLDRLADLFRSGLIDKGEVRLIGMIDKPMAGLQVDPAASQSVRGATLVVANLQFPRDKDPEPDANSRRDFVTGRGGERLDLDEPDDTTDPDAELNPSP
jgi:hypothetical protein